MVPAAEEERTVSVPPPPFFQPAPLATAAEPIIAGDSFDEADSDEMVNARPRDTNSSEPRTQNIINILSQHYGANINSIFHKHALIKYSIRYAPQNTDETIAQNIFSTLALEAASVPGPTVPISLFDSAQNKACTLVARDFGTSRSITKSTFVDGEFNKDFFGHAHNAVNTAMSFAVKALQLAGTSLGSNAHMTKRESLLAPALDKFRTNPFDRQNREDNMKEMVFINSFLPVVEKPPQHARFLTIHTRFQWRI